MRQIVIDTETTGLEIEQGHRIIEIGCLELNHRKFSGKTFHRYINPQRAIDAEALTVHGITQNFLADKPTFNEILDELLVFLGNAELIAHNASFDIGFINHEMGLATNRTKQLEDYQITVVDTLEIARKKFPGQRNTLDALCKRYKIDLHERKAKGHGALLDAELLAKVYLFMTGGQSNLFKDLEQEPKTSQLMQHSSNHNQLLRKNTSVIHATAEEIMAHDNMLITIEKTAGTCLWKSQR